MRTSFLRLLATLALSVGCGGNAIDLGHGDDWADLPAADENEAAPQTLYRSGEQVFGFTADDTTLYALVTRDSVTLSAAAFELVSCPIAACKSQRKTLYSGPLLWDLWSGSSLTLIDGSLLWLFPSKGIASCSVHGCSEIAFVPADTEAIAGDDEHVYWLEANSALMRLAPARGEPERVRSFPSLDVGLVTEVSAHGSFVHFVTGDRSTIYRIPKDGTRDPAPVVMEENVASVDVSGDELYYSSSILAGHIARCNVNDCEASAVTLVEQQRWPDTIRVDHGEIFWLVERPQADRSETVSLASCELPDCKSVKSWPFATTLRAPSDLLVNLNYVIWIADYLEFGTALKLVPR